MMPVSLLRYLRTGELGPIALGTPQDRVPDLLGPPDAVGCTSRRHRRPSAFLYGDAQLFFDRTGDRRCMLIWVESHVEKSRFEFPDRWVVEDWDLTPEMGREDVKAYLRRHRLAYCERQGRDESYPVEFTIQPSYVSVLLEPEDDRLCCIGFGGRGRVSPLPS